MPPPADLGVLLQQIQYPGMTWVESQVFKRWLNAHGAEYDEVMLNVRLGEGGEVPEGVDAETADMWRKLTQKRADVVCRSADQVDLIEVKVRVAFGVIGQLIGYRGLWRRLRPDLPVRRLIAIGRSVVPDMATIIEESGVTIETFPQQEGG